MAIKNEIKLKKTVSWLENEDWQNEDMSYELKNNKFKVHGELKSPNISSHVLVNLCGLNRYASVGSTLLSMYGLTVRNKIPLYQSKKGGIVEEFANRYLDEVYGGRYDIESFELAQFTGFNQFPESAPFSGALDKLIHMPTKLPVEIKSKEAKDYTKIAINRNYPKEQIVQGANQAYMYGAEKFMMLYGFLSKELSEYLKAVCKEEIVIKQVPNALGIIEEKEVVESLWTWGDDYAQAIEDLGIQYEDITFHHEVMDFDPRIIKAYRDKAQKLAEDFKRTKTLDKHLFKKDELYDIMKYANKE